MINMHQFPIALGKWILWKNNIVKKIMKILLLVTSRLVHHSYNLRPKGKVKNGFLFTLASYPLIAQRHCELDKPAVSYNNQQ